MKVWTLIEGDAARARELAGALGVPAAMARVLAALGYRDAESAGRFLQPRLNDLSDPARVPDMAPAVERILAAIERGETILVFGDYDVDGVVGTGLLVKVLARLEARLAPPCLPRRETEGYGLSVAGLARATAGIRPSLLVTVDCGTNDAEAVRQAHAAGLDVIVTDHHERTGAAAEALATVNPNAGTAEDLRVLAGVGVVFKLCHGLVKAARARGWPCAADLDLREYLDCVAVGTVADIVPLTGENRILVRHGLDRMRDAPRLCWQSLAEVAGVRGPIETHDIAFRLGPRLNAAGRLGAADTAFELLMTEEPKRARDLAVCLDEANRERQRIERDMLVQAQADLEAQGGADRLPALVVGRPGWHHGVVGIVASRLVARYRRPAVVVSFGRDGSGRGSARSLEGYHLLQALESCRGHLQGFGGHALAAGVRVEQDRFDAFRAAFCALAETGLEGLDVRPQQPVHACVGLDEVDDALAEALERLRPFGQANPRPVLAVRGARLCGRPRVVGGKHLRFTLSAGSVRRPAIAFEMAEHGLPSGALDVAFTLRRDRFMNVDTLELNVQDVRSAE